MRPRGPAKATPPSARRVLARLEELGDPKDASFLLRYFKTGPGEYGEGDTFLGIRVPVLRKLSREYETLPLVQCRVLLRSRFHEARLLALLILVRRFTRGDADSREAIHRLYLANTAWVNNWDLVDSSAPTIVGGHLTARNRSLLRTLARSESVWERRIAILATLPLISRGEFADTFRIADLLLEDEHDLIHKAAGWMIREVGKRDRVAAAAFLRSRYERMPRTMLRYAIEKLPEPTRKRYLRGEV